MKSHTRKIEVRWGSEVLVIFVSTLKVAKREKVYVRNKKNPKK